MNKNLILAALAAVAVGCNNDDVLVDNQKDANVPIAFTTFADKATRTPDKPTGSDFFLEDYHLTFAVYGTKKANVGGEVSYVFGDNATAITQITKYNGVTCTFDDSDPAPTGEWVYSPHRYWDTQAVYKFMAYAPANAPIRYIYGAAGDEVGATGYKFLSTAPYTIKGQNLQMPINGYAGPGKAPYATAAEINTGFDGIQKNNGFFTPLSDIDIMVTNNVATEDGAIHKTTDSDVDLIFSHTLAKINVKMDVETNAPTTGTAGYKVNVTSVNLANFLSTGAYDSSAPSKWIVDNSTSAGKVNYDFYRTPGVQLDEAGKYFIESLVMPQAINANQVVTLKYTITSIDAAGNTYSEDFVYQTTLGEIFKVGTTTPIANEYLSNSNYTITFHLNPENNVIKFDAGVAKWATKISSEETIE